jgi:hypothetical protein
MRGERDLLLFQIESVERAIDSGERRLATIRREHTMVAENLVRSHADLVRLKSRLAGMVDADA